MLRGWTGSIHSCGCVLLLCRFAGSKRQAYSIAAILQDWVLLTASWCQRLLTGNLIFSIQEYPEEKFVMDSHVYKTIQVTGTSDASADDAVRTAVERAAITVHNLKWFKVTETRGYIKDGKIAQWQVSIDLGFALE